MFVFFPYSDEAPREHFPFLTVGIIILCIASYIHFNFRPDYEQIMNTYGFVPARFSWFTMITSTFLHANFFHLLSNMWFLWIFADNIEDATGRLFFLALYIFGAFAAGLMHYFLASPLSKTLPCVGASGAVSAVLGAYLVLFPKAKVKMLVGILWWFRLKKISAVYYIGFWFLLQYAMTFFQELGNIAYAAHVGGFAWGLLAGYLFNEYMSPAEARISGGNEKIF